MPSEPLEIAHYPNDAVEATLEKCYTYSMFNAKYLLYSLVSLTTSDLETINRTITEEYHKWLGDKPSEDEEPLLDTAPKWDFSSGTLQDVFNHHITSDFGWSESGGNNEGQVDVYPFGFVVVDSANWREDGVIILAAEDIEDYDPDLRKEKAGETERKWWVDAARFTVENAGWIITSMWRDDDENFYEAKLAYSMSSQDEERYETYEEAT